MRSIILDLAKQKITKCFSIPFRDTIKTEDHLRAKNVQFKSFFFEETCEGPRTYRFDSLCFDFSLFFSRTLSLFRYVVSFVLASKTCVLSPLSYSLEFLDFVSNLFPVLPTFYSYIYFIEVFVYLFEARR